MKVGIDGLRADFGTPPGAGPFPGVVVLHERATDPELRRIPVIVVSANRAPEIATAVDKGICAFLPKPFDINVLNALVRSCLATEEPVA